MRKPKEKPYGPALEKLMSEKTKVLSQAQAFAQMGMDQTVLPLWQSAGSLEERIAPRLDAIGRNHEAALHRVSAATCYRNAGEFSKAIRDSFSAEFQTIFQPLFQTGWHVPMSDAQQSNDVLHEIG